VTASITCREFVEFLADYLGGELDAARRDEFELHLACCPSCVAYMKSYRATERLERGTLLGVDHVPADVPGDLIRAILAARSAS
jgi:anti-sigma factor RsiW